MAGTLVAVQGHEQQRAWLRTGAGRSLAFVGPDAVGRRTVARWWATWLNCAASTDEPCGRCSSCRAAAAGAHPDLRTVAPATATSTGRPSRRPQIRIDQLVPRDRPGADPDPLTEWLRSRPRFRARVAVIDAAHTVTEQAGNAFLKMLEEPPSWARIVLIAPDPAALLPTLASRCTVLRFGAAPVTGFRDLAPHPALRSGQYGRLQQAREAPDREEAVRRTVAEFVAALPGPLSEALPASVAWVRACSEDADLDPAGRLFEALRRDLPEAYGEALEAVPEATAALAAYVTPQVVAYATALRLRRPLRQD